MTSIWKQCNLAESGSAERANVCLMWDCPGHVIALFMSRVREDMKKKQKTVKRCKQWAKAYVLMPPPFCLPHAL